MLTAMAGCIRPGARRETERAILAVVPTSGGSARQIAALASVSLGYAQHVLADLVERGAILRWSPTPNPASVRLYFRAPIAHAQTVRCIVQRRTDLPPGRHPTDVLWEP